MQVCELKQSLPILDKNYAARQEKDTCTILCRKFRTFHIMNLLTMLFRNGIDRQCYNVEMRSGEPTFYLIDRVRSRTTVGMAAHKNEFSGCSFFCNPAIRTLSPLKS